MPLGAIPRNRAYPDSRGYALVHLTKQLSWLRSLGRPRLRLATGSSAASRIAERSKLARHLLLIALVSSLVGVAPVDADRV
ncbi:hypothetical protein E143388_07871 [Rhodococcus opacus]|nr:hypothetical protein E143388_07871 [Rhodococcus opacus]